MAGLFVNQGEAILLDLICNKGTYALDNLKLKIYKNDYTPVDGSTEANFTEADFTGYPAGGIELTGANWTITPGAPSTATFAKQTFTSSADQTLQYLYGYYLVRKTDGKCVAGERFTDGPYAIVNNLDYAEVTPALSMRKSGE